MLPGIVSCPYCGAGNPANAMYCAGCGNILRGMDNAGSQTFISSPGERNTTGGQFAPTTTFMSSPSAPTSPASAPLMAPPPPPYSQVPQYNAPLAPPPDYSQFFEPTTGRTPARRASVRPGRLAIVALLLIGLIIVGGGGVFALTHLTQTPKPHPGQSSLTPLVTSSTAAASAPSPTTAPTQAPTPGATAKPTQAPAATPTAAPSGSGYPQLAVTYKGTAHNTTAGQSSGITLSSIKEGPQGNFTGYLTVAPPLGGSGPITGAVSKNGAIQFTSQPTDGTAPINWYGTIHPNGSISGTYTVPAYQQKGTWQASPA
jgi:hypothetical protein